MRRLQQPALSPGGTWINPSNNLGTGGPVHLAAHAYPTHSGDPAIDHVNFTVWWPGLGPKTGSWDIACTVPAPTAGTVTVSQSDIYQCGADLLYLGAPEGTLTLSFDVYDVAGNVNKSPQGERTIQWQSGGGDRMYAAIDWAQAQLGNSSTWDGYCEVFIENAYGVSRGGGASGTWDTAYDAFQSLKSLGDTSSSPRMPGMMVYFDKDSGNENAGHVGIYMGDGWMISATDYGVEWDRISDWSRIAGPSVLGYSWPPSGWQRTGALDGL